MDQSQSSTGRYLVQEKTCRKS
uniref:Uncharacterized protein n=1 Tax=Arundo donax TaxID=35708 RepID=A0A0A9GMW4_ARUDO